MRPTRPPYSALRRAIATLVLLPLVAPVACAPAWNALHRGAGNRTMTITGRLTDANSRPIVGVRIASMDSASAVMSDSSGAFTLTVPPRTTALTFEHPGYLRMVLPDLDSTSRQQYVDLRMMSNREAVLSIQHLAVGDAFVTPLLLPPWSKMLAVIRIPPDSIRIGFGLDSTATVNRGIDHVEVVRGAGALQLFGDMGGLGVVILTLSSKPK